METHTLITAAVYISLNHKHTPDLRLMGTKEEDGVFVSWRLHGSLWQLVNLNDQEDTVKLGSGTLF